MLNDLRNNFENAQDRVNKNLMSDIGLYANSQELEDLIMFQKCTDQYVKYMEDQVLEGFSSDDYGKGLHIAGLKFQLNRQANTNAAWRQLMKDFNKTNRILKVKFNHD